MGLMVIFPWTGEALIVIIWKSRVFRILITMSPMRNETALDLAILLKFGLADEFEINFRRALAKDNIDSLVSCLNDELGLLARDAGIKVLLSRREEKDQSYVTVVGQSRFFGDNWPVRRQSFSI